MVNALHSLAFFSAKRNKQPLKYTPTITSVITPYGEPHMPVSGVLGFRDVEAKANFPEGTLHWQSPVLGKVHSFMWGIHPDNGQLGHLDQKHIWHPFTSLDNLKLANRTIYTALNGMIPRNVRTAMHLARQSIHKQHNGHAVPETAILQMPLPTGTPQGAGHKRRIYTA